MKKFLITIFIAVSGLVMLLPVVNKPVYAQIDICDFVGPICTAIGIEDASDPTSVAANFVDSRLNLIISLIFIGITLFAVFIIIQAAVKYIQSQGNEEKIGEAQKAIKAVFIGIAVLIVGVVGLLLVFAFLGGGSGFFQTEDEICLQACEKAGGGTVECLTKCADGVYDPNDQ